MNPIIISLFIFLLFPVLKLHAQIYNGDSIMIFQDYKPDLKLSSYDDSIKIDIDRDGTLDIQFYKIHTSYGGEFYTESINDNFQFAYFYASSGFIIDSLTSDSLNWGTSRLMWIDQFYHGKLGLKLTIGQQSYYGWLFGADVWTGGANGSHILTIDQYAFCTIPDYPLLWGQAQITNSVEILKSEPAARIYKKSVDNQLVVQSGEKIKQMKLLNLSGATVATLSKVQSNQSVLPLNNIPHGTYIVEVIFLNNKVFISKVVL